MYSLVSLLSSIYPLHAMHSLLVTLYVMEYLIIRGHESIVLFSSNKRSLNKNTKVMLTVLQEVQSKRDTMMVFW